MKIGVITDIHSNIQALTAVLNEFDKRKVEKIICCGDIIGIGINPEETVQELIKREDMLISVRGNHEQYLFNGIPSRIHDNNRELNEEEHKNHVWNHSKLSKESIDFLSRFKMSEKVEIEGKRIYIAHYPLNSDNTYKRHIKEPTIEENIELFKEVDADIFLYGHTHTYSVNCKDNKWYINPGSLGCPLNTDIAKAGILEIDNSKIEFNPINLKYNVEEIVEEMNRLKFPHYKGILKVFYGR